MIVVRPASIEDAIWLSSRLRAEDVQEVETATGLSPQRIVPLCFQHSDECYTVRRVVDGRVAIDPVAIFGSRVDQADTSRGVIWLLGTPDIRLCALSMVREAGYWLNHMSRRFSKGLYNYADVRNTLHVRWCQLAGFTLGETVIIGGSPFHTIQRPQCVLIQ